MNGRMHIRSDNLVTSISYRLSTYHRPLFPIPGTLASDRSILDRSISRHIRFNVLRYLRSFVGRQNHHLGLMFGSTTILVRNGFGVERLSRNEVSIRTRRSSLRLLLSATSIATDQRVKAAYRNHHLQFLPFGYVLRCFLGAT